MRIFRNRAPSFQRLWNKLPILSKHNLDCEWIASFYYQMALKTSASLFIFSCDIIGSKGKTENMQAVLEKESSAHIKRRSRDYRKRAEMWRLSGHAWTSEGTIKSSNLEKNEVIVLLRRRISFSGVHVTSLFFVVCHQIYKIPTTCSNERGFRSSNNSEKAKKTVLIYKGQFSSRTKWVRHRVFLKFHFSHICTFSELFSRSK